MRIRMILIGCLFLLSFTHLFSATGCDLNDPDHDVKRLFPSSTSYKANYVSIKSKGGDALLKNIESRLGDSFTGTYETIDVPYTMYSIYKNKDLIGYIHGVNQKGQYGGIQVFLAVDTQGVIQHFNIQKMTSPGAKIWRDPSFASQFKSLTLNDFIDYKPGSELKQYKKIKNPDKDTAEFNRILRAVKKNLILIDVFLLKKVK